MDCLSVTFQADESLAFMEAEDRLRVQLAWARHLAYHSRAAAGSWFTRVFGLSTTSSRVRGDMTSDTRIPYGDRASRHGSERRCVSENASRRARLAATPRSFQHLLALAAAATAFFAGSPAALSTQTPAAEADSAAARLTAELIGVPWGSTCDVWAERVQGAECQTYRGTGSSTFFFDFWCHRGSAPPGVGRVFFYAPPAASPPRCLLEQYHGRVPLSDSVAAEESHRELAARLEARFGPPNDSPRVRASGSAHWRDVHLWATDSLEVIAYYLPADREEGPALGLLARRRSLLERAARDDSLRWDREPDPHAVAAARVLRSRAPDLADWLAEGDRQPPAVQPEPTAVLADLLEDAREAPRAERAALLFAADHLAARVVEAIEPDAVPTEGRAVTQPEVEAIEALGLTVSWNPLGYSWGYEHDLMLRLVEEFPDTEWGERATVELIVRGGSGASICPGGMDVFRVVIEEGEAFLRTLPDSPFREEVEFALAQAYDTWWSVSLGKEDSYVSDPGAYAEGADEARLRAIELYQELLGSEGRRGWIAARQLPRLELGLDTNQRAYFCVYD